MKKVYLLDCTLRDGGYINNWMFGYQKIQNILNHLSKSNVEYIECGYLTERYVSSPDSTKFTSLSEVKSILPDPIPEQHFVVMIDYGTYDVNHLPNVDSNSVFIRVCFHKKNAEEALCYCEELIKKGYKVFVQPMVTTSYSDVEFLQIIEKVNCIKPVGFYIVDSFGSIELADFQRLLFLTDHNLSPTLLLGYHAHNNLQQAYENAKYMVSAELLHDVVLDASVYGMGRGAGNLNMELFASYLNTHLGKAYNINDFLEIMDEHLKPIFSEKYWGYSLPFYLSARSKCHPNYAAYFAEKNTLSCKSLSQLLMSLPEEDKVYFFKEKAEEHYSKFVSRNIDDRYAVEYLKEAFKWNNLLILAPGRSLLTERKKIQKYIFEHNCLTIAVGALPNIYECDYLFFSNERRFSQLRDFNIKKLILTSNIQVDSPDYIKINYSSYLVGDEMIAANPVLMVLQLLISIGIKEVAIAGFDGYSFTAEENYYDPKLAMGSSFKNKMERNSLISKAIKEIENRISINFITNSLYIK